MQTLNSILAGARQRWLNTGGQPSQIIDTLRDHQRRNGWLCAALTAAFVLAAGLGAYGLIRASPDLGAAAALAAGLAALAGVFVEALRRAWLERNRTEVFLALIEAAPEHEIVALTDTWLRKL